MIEVSPETVNAENTWWMPLHVLRQLNWEHVPTHARAAVRGNAAWPYLEARLVPTYTYRKQIVAEAKEEVRGWWPTPAAGGGTPAAGAGPDAAAPELDGDHPAPEKRATTNWSRTAGSAEHDDPQVAHPIPDRRAGGAALERMLDKCRSAGIRVVLLGVPTCSPHRAGYTPPIEARLRRLHSEARDRVRLPVRGRPRLGPDAMFRDTLHVDVAGGKLFTRRLAREVLKRLPAD